MHIGVNREQVASVHGPEALRPRPCAAEQAWKSICYYIDGNECSAECITKRFHLHMTIVTRRRISNMPEVMYKV
jgi:hypothetical protein